MKKVFVFLLVTMFAGSVWGQTTKESLAVYVSGSGDEGIKKVIGARLVSEITKFSDDYAAVERTADFLFQLRKEQDFQQGSGNVRDDQFAALGRYFGVKVVVVADVMDVLGSCFVSARMINVETGLVTATADSEKELNTASDLVSLAENVASKLVKSVDACTRKDKRVGDNGCCEGLTIVNGICRDITNGMIWLDTGNCNLVFAYEQGDNGNTPKVTYEKFENARCPKGYRWPTIEEIKCLAKIYPMFTEGYWWTKRYSSGIPGIDRTIGAVVSYRKYSGEWAEFHIYEKEVDTRMIGPPQITIKEESAANCVCIREK